MNKAGIEPQGRYVGVMAAGCEPDEAGIGPIHAVPPLLKAHRLKMDDIGLWELNEAFAVQVIYSRDELGNPDDILNVDGGAISIGHPYGISGARMVGHALIEGKRRGRPVRSALTGAMREQVGRRCLPPCMTRA